jgi:chromosome segregation ATPase
VIINNFNKMDIKNVKLSLETWVNEKQDELDAFKLALSILDETFKPEITALTNAQAEADTQRVKAIQLENSVANLSEIKVTLEGKITEHETTIAEKEESINAKDSELAQKVLEIEALTAEKVDLQTQLNTIFDGKDTLEPLPVDEIITP